VREESSVATKYASGGERPKTVCNTSNKPGKTRSQ